jgi:hypothetical protein
MPRLTSLEGTFSQIANCCLIEEVKRPES